MRSNDEYKQILELWELGIPKKTIAQLTKIPRSTVIECIQRYPTIEALERKTVEIATPLVLKILKGEIEAPNNEIYKAYAYVLGLYLGDGCIVKMRKVYWLRISLDAKYPDIIDACRRAIQTLLPENKVALIEHHYREQLSHIDVSVTHKYLEQVFPQHGKGMKHTRTIALEPWQQRIVDAYPLDFFRGLYHSDGSRFSNVVNGKDYPRYSFTNNSQDILKLFCDTCDKLGVHWTVKARRSQARDHATDIFISKRPDVEYLDRVVGVKS